MAPGPVVPRRSGSSYSTHRCGRGRASGDRLLHERCPVSVTKDPPGPRHCAPQGSSSCLRLGFPGSRRELTCGRRLCLDGWTWAGVGQEGSDGVLLGNVAGHATQDTRDLSGCTGETEFREKADTEKQSEWADGASAGSARVCDPPTLTRLGERTRASPWSACRSRGKACSPSPRRGTFVSTVAVRGRVHSGTDGEGRGEEAQDGLCTHRDDVPLAGRHRTPVPAPRLSSPRPRHINARKDWL